MKLKSILGVASSVLVVSLLLSPVVHAQAGADSVAAQSLFDQAKVLLSEGRAAEACPKLEESQRLDPKSGTLLNLASCYEQDGKLASAWAKYLEAAPAARAAGNTEREAVARERAAALVPRLAKLAVDVPPALKGLAGLQVLRDGVVMGPAQWGLEMPADEGQRRLSATAPGYKPWEGTTAVKGEGTLARVAVPMLEVDPNAKQVDTRVDFGRPTGAPATGLGAQRIGAIVAGGVGVLGLGAGAFFGLEAQSKKDTSDKDCTAGNCTSQAGVDAGNDARSAATVSTILVAVGAVGVATGVTLWLTAPATHDGREGVGVGISLGSVQLRGSW